MAEGSSPRRSLASALYSGGPGLIRLWPEFSTVLCLLVQLGYHWTERLVRRMTTKCASILGAYGSAGKTSKGSWKSPRQGAQAAAVTSL